mgnify:CR=1 FL=1
MKSLSSIATGSVCGLMGVAIAHIEDGNYSEARRVLGQTIVDLGGSFEFGEEE